MTQEIKKNSSQKQHIEIEVNNFWATTGTVLKQGGYMIQKTHLAFKIESEQSPLRQVNSVGVHLGNGPQQLFYI